ncbi:MAG TPA: tetratricopeptide repeat protein, partial [Candidatus Eisenbacteria bacterium]|nr:tetratricopeptide repeat protein [Candidatus Eisenbacteria bacterium]
ARPSSGAPVSSGVAAPSAPGREVPSIAVLPFVNRSRVEEDEYFSDGLADELLNVLTKVRGLRVVARASSFQFKGKNEDLAVIGDKLNVATLLDGSVRKSGTRVRISVQLVRAADRVQLWSETYDRSLEDIFAVQDDIAQAVVKELRTTLLGEASDSDVRGQVKADVANALKGYGHDPEAHRLYLQGKFLIDRVTPRDGSAGMHYIEQALALDPTHAMAWADLARGHVLAAGYSWEPLADGFRKAREAVARALAVDPDLAEAHAQLSMIQRIWDWDWNGAERSARRALELAPGNAEILRSAGALAQALGHLEESVAYLRRTVEQDPLTSTGYNALALAYRSMGRLEQAEQTLRKSLEIAPQRVITHHLLAVVMAAQGRAIEALSEAALEPAEWARLTSLAYANHVAGRTLEADAALAQLETNHAADSAYQIAIVHAVRGEVDAAFAWMNRAIDEHDAGASQLQSEPSFAELKSDPRWNVLLQRLRFVD